jgi:hypothetical protein
MKLHQPAGRDAESPAFRPGVFQARLPDQRTARRVPTPSLVLTHEAGATCGVRWPFRRLRAGFGPTSGPYGELRRGCFVPRKSAAQRLSTHNVSQPIHPLTPRALDGCLYPRPPARAAPAAVTYGTHILNSRIRRSFSPAILRCSVFEGNAIRPILCGRQREFQKLPLGD